MRFYFWLVVTQNNWWPLVLLVLLNLVFFPMIIIGAVIDQVFGVLAVAVWALQVPLYMLVGKVARELLAELTHSSSVTAGLKSEPTTIRVHLRALPRFAALKLLEDSGCAGRKRGEIDPLRIEFFVTDLGVNTARSWPPEREGARSRR